MTGVAPADLLEDELLYAACHEEALAARWTDLHELLALNTELTHAVLCQLIANSGAKRGDIPKPMRIPRPGDPPPEPPPTLSATAVAEMFRRGRS